MFYRIGHGWSHNTLIIHFICTSILFVHKSNLPNPFERIGYFPVSSDVLAILLNVNRPKCTQKGSEGPTDYLLPLPTSLCHYGSSDVASS